MEEKRKLLSDIVGGKVDSLNEAWDRTVPAKDFELLPAGTYIGSLVGGELKLAKTGTPGYKLTFRIVEGDHAGHMTWHDLWLTPPAMPMAKRDLEKLGIKDLKQLERKIPPGIRCKLKVVVRKSNDGTEHNRVTSFEVVGVDSADDPEFGPPSAVADAGNGNNSAETKETKKKEKKLSPIERAERERRKKVIP